MDPRFSFDPKRGVESADRIMKRFAVRPLVLISTILTACAVPTGGSPTHLDPPTPFSSSPPSASATVLPSPTPPLDASFQDVTLIPGRFAGDWSVIGLVRNQSAEAVGDLVLEISLYDEGDVALAHAAVMPALPTLGPGDQSPFRVRFTGVGAADHARAEVVAYRPSKGSSIPVELSQLETWPMGDGTIALFGSAANGIGQSIEIEGLVIMATSPTGEPLAVSDTVLGLSVLGPGDSAPFVTVLETDAASAVMKGFASGRPAARRDPRMSLVSPLRIDADQHGTPLVIGALHNDSQDWQTADLVVSLREGDELMGLGEIELPWPLAPGETQPFLLNEFPGLRQRMNERGLEPGDLSATSELDSAGSRTTTSTPIALDISVTAQEVIGGSLFLKGTLTNGGSQNLDHPGAIAVLRSTQGEVLSAGFVSAGEELEAGATLSFTLTLPLPKGVDLAMAEFDVRAAGFLQE